MIFNYNKRKIAIERLVLIIQSFNIIMYNLLKSTIIMN
jgi:hypothetical protein